MYLTNIYVSHMCLTHYHIWVRHMSTHIWVDGSHICVTYMSTHIWILIYCLVVWSYAWHIYEYFDKYMTIRHMIGVQTYGTHIWVFRHMTPIYGYVCPWDGVHPVGRSILSGLVAWHSLKFLLLSSSSSHIVKPRFPHGIPPTVYTKWDIPWGTSVYTMEDMFPTV